MRKLELLIWNKTNQGWSLDPVTEFMSSACSFSFLNLSKVICKGGMRTLASWDGYVIARTNCTWKLFVKLESAFNIHLTYESCPNGLLENFSLLFPVNLLGHSWVTACVNYFLRFLVWPQENLGGSRKWGGGECSLQTCMPLKVWLLKIKMFITFFMVSLCLLP